MLSNTKKEEMFIVRFIQIALLIIISISSAFSQGGTTTQNTATQKVFQTEIVRSVKVPYYLSLPQGYDKGEKKHPLLLYLHGAGERGDDLEILNANGLPMLINNKKIQFPFITVAPQCPTNDAWWNFTQNHNLNELLDYIIENYNVDENRIYLTGLSMGGWGAWGLAAMYPNRFAAVAPICGGWFPEDAIVFKHIPIWVFHGAKDQLAPIKNSDNMVDALKKLGGNVKYTIYPEAGHDSWTETYFNPELFEWFLSHRKQNGHIVSSQETDLLSNETKNALSFYYLKHRLKFTDIKRGTEEDITFSLEINNHLTVPISVKEKWNYAKGSTWKVKALNKIASSIQPGETRTIKYAAKNKNKGNPFPLPQFNLSITSDVHQGQSEFMLPFDVDRYLEKHTTFQEAIKTELPPKIDGKLDDIIWKENNDGIVNFLSTQLTQTPAVNTEAWIAYDSSYCYLAIKCEEPYMNQLVTEVKEDNGPIWTDDSIEFFLDPQNDRKKYFQFIVNSNGKIFDAFNGDSSFTSGSKIATQIDSDSWFLEMAIPWEKLNTKPPEKGKHMGFLIGRNRIEKEEKSERGIGQVLQYPPTNGNNNRKEFFGNLKF